MERVVYQGLHDRLGRVLHNLNDPKAFAVCRGVAVLFWGTFLGINKGSADF